MITLSKQVDYGVQLLMVLGSLEGEAHLSLKQFATERNISFLFLQKIARRLREAGLIRSQMGAAGGYQLAHTPEHISLKSIVEAIEGPYAAAQCVRMQQCPIETDCPSRHVFSFIQKDIDTQMEKYSLEKMISLAYGVSK